MACPIHLPQPVHDPEDPGHRAVHFRSATWPGCWTSAVPHQQEYRPARQMGLVARHAKPDDRRSWRSSCSTTAGTSSRNSTGSSAEKQKHVMDRLSTRGKGVPALPGAESHRYTIAEEQDIGPICLQCGGNCGDRLCDRIRQGLAPFRIKNSPGLYPPRRNMGVRTGSGRGNLGGQHHGQPSGFFQNHRDGRGHRGPDRGRGRGLGTAARPRPGQVRGFDRHHPLHRLPPLRMGLRRAERSAPRAIWTAYDDTSVFDEMRRPDARATRWSTGTPPPEGPTSRWTSRSSACTASIRPAFRPASWAPWKRTPMGPVTYDAWKCIGCRYCMVACPFQIPAYEYHDALTPRVMKCTMCAERTLEEGKPPACVEMCPPRSPDLRQAQRTAGTGPRAHRTSIPDRYHRPRLSASTTSAAPPG